MKRRAVSLASNIQVQGSDGLEPGNETQHHLIKTKLKTTALDRSHLQRLTKNS